MRWLRLIASKPITQGVDMKIKQPHGRKPLMHKTQKNLVEGLDVINGSIIPLMSEFFVWGGFFFFF
jgi:hypothetical protein